MIHQTLLKAAAVPLILLFAIAGCERQGSAEGYSTSEVSFENGDVTLAGSLTVPNAIPEGGAPAVIFVPGSGNNTREVFQRLADWYTGLGFVVLAYDKRGAGESGGSWVSSSLEDLAGDVAAGLALLEARPEVDTDRIGVWAISQGGWVLPVASRLSDAPDWAIAVSGGGASPRETEMYAYRGALTHGGIGEEGQAAALALVERYFDYMASGEGREELVSAIEAAKHQLWYEFVPLGRIMPSSEEGRLNWEWVATFEALAVASEISFPVLAMIGGRDFNLPPEAALQGWKDAFAASGIEGSKAVLFPKGGHGLGYRGHDAAMRGEYVEGYFETQEAWLKEIGVLE